MTAAEEKKLRRKCRKKCENEDSDLFKTVLRFDEDGEETTSDWYDFFNKYCNKEELLKITELDLKLGYNVNDIDDMRNYFDNLPKKQQLEIIENLDSADKQNLTNEDFL